MTKEWDFSLGRMYFTGDDGYHIFLAFTAMLSSLTFDKNNKFLDWMSTRIFN